MHYLVLFTMSMLIHEKKKKQMPFPVTGNADGNGMIVTPENELKATERDFKLSNSRVWNDKE